MAKCKRRQLNVLKSPVSVLDSDSGVLVPRRGVLRKKYSKSWLDAVKLGQHMCLAASGCEFATPPDVCNLYGESCTKEESLGDHLNTWTVNDPEDPLMRYRHEGMILAKIVVSVDTSDPEYWVYDVTYGVTSYTVIIPENYYDPEDVWRMKEEDVQWNTPSSDISSWPCYGWAQFGGYYDEEFQIHLDLIDADNSNTSSGVLSAGLSTTYENNQLTFKCLGECSDPSAQANPKVEYLLYFEECS